MKSLVLLCMPLVLIAACEGAVNVQQRSGSPEDERRAGDPRGSGQLPPGETETSAGTTDNAMDDDTEGEGVLPDGANDDLAADELGDATQPATNESGAADSPDSAPSDESLRGTAAAIDGVRSIRLISKTVDGVDEEVGTAVIQSNGGFTFVDIPPDPEAAAWRLEALDEGGAIVGIKDLDAPRNEFGDMAVVDGVSTVAALVRDIPAVAHVSPRALEEVVRSHARDVQAPSAILQSVFASPGFREEVASLAETSTEELSEAIAADFGRAVSSTPLRQDLESVVADVRAENASTSEAASIEVSSSRRHFQSRSVMTFALQLPELLGDPLTVTNLTTSTTLIDSPLPFAGTEAGPGFTISIAPVASDNSRVSWDIHLFTSAYAEGAFTGGENRLRFAFADGRFVEQTVVLRDVAAFAASGLVHPRATPGPTLEVFVDALPSRPAQAPGTGHTLHLGVFSMLHH